MKAKVIRFPQRMSAAVRQPKPAIVVVLPVIRIESYGRTSRRQWRGKRHRDREAKT